MLEKLNDTFKHFENAYLTDGVRSAHERAFSDFSATLKSLDDRIDSLLGNSFIRVNKPSECFYLQLTCTVETSTGLIEVNQDLYARQTFPESFDQSEIEIRNVPMLNLRSEEIQSPKLFWAMTVWGTLTSEHDLPLFSVGGIGSTITFGKNSADFIQKLNQISFSELTHGIGELLELNDADLVDLLERNAINF